MKQKQCKFCGKKFKPKLPIQVDCSELCLANRFDTYTRKTRKLAKIFASTLGYRSMSEVRFAVKLKSLKIRFDYEKHKFQYQHKPQKYTVDFTVDAKDGHKIHYEFKGKLDSPTRKKLRAIKASNPTMDLRLVFEKPNNKLYKGAKLRYWEWAERYGFTWYDWRDIRKIKQELKMVKEP